MVNKFCFITFVVFILAANTIFASGYLKTSGKNIVNSQGSQILLKGINLGNWLIQEGYMMQTSSFANSETEIRNKITALIGANNTAEFYKAWNDNYITKKDIDQIASWGFNSIRLPMHYAKLTPKDQPGVYLEEGFATIDSVLSWCEQNNIYLILDLHAAPGAQNALNISDSDGQARLWTEELNKTRTIQLWGKLAQRYANKQWIGGYDLLNETAYSFPNNNNSPLWNLMDSITSEIRKYDNNHIVFIEGNWFATDFNNLPSVLWDNNLVLSFHKYWNQTDQGTINYLINLSNNYNVPLWLGETGENSNGWFTECIELMKANNIGYCFWPFKKIASISGLVTSPVTPNYQVLLNYWNGNGSQPTVDFAKNALFGMLNALAFDRCHKNIDVVDAMFRQVNNNLTIPFINNSVPGTIFAVDYDLGKYGYAYSDVIYKNSNNSDVYNSGWNYRNDGVDIERCTDILNYVGYNVGWIENGEWLKYTFNVQTDGMYDLTYRASGGQAGGKIINRIDNVQVGSIVSIPTTGGWQSWQSINAGQVRLTPGTHSMQLQFLFGGFNLSSVDFVLNPSAVDDKDMHPTKFCLNQNYPNPFNPETIISYELASSVKVTLKIYDLLGNQVALLVNENQPAGQYKVPFKPVSLSNGVYFYHLEAGSFSQTKKLIYLK